ncbi:lipopolysaccharide biosynthesis protein [Lutimonas sp.]|uniref:lipopolysaccharide biosynthesis protein n=1 Tax=Lutimonas sp. TaxID=1872403 RepID=UPI003D9AC87E
MQEGKFLDAHVFKKDFLWYFLGSSVPMILGFIKTPIFTRHFDKASFGELGIVSITYTFLGMIFFSWISSCLWRYYAKYREEGALVGLYSNLATLFLISCFFLSFFTVGWFVRSENELVKDLILFSFLQLVFNQLFMGYMVVVRLNGKSGYYTMFHGIKSVLGFLLALLLVFHYQQSIVALVSSLAVIDLAAMLVLAYLNPAGISLAIKEVRIVVIKQLLTYGGAGLILNISLLSIAYSDRYIIAWYYKLEEVGIYDQVSKIAQLSVLALITVYFNTINPRLLRRLETDFKAAEEELSVYMYPFLLIGVPIVFYLSLFSEELATVLLGPAFREAYLIMPFIFAATFLHGLSNFFELRLKFSNQLTRLGLIALLTAGLNVLLNLLLVGSFGYEWAARSTLISYVFMLILLLTTDSFIRKLPYKWIGEISKIIGVLLLQFLLYKTVIYITNLQLLGRISIGLLFLSMYFIIFKNSITSLKLPNN